MPDRCNTVFAWTETVESLIKAKATVLQHCECRPPPEIPLHPALKQLGPSFTFWNRQEICPACGSTAWFSARTAHGGFPVQMRGGWEKDVNRLQEAWRVSRVSTP